MARFMDFHEDLKLPAEAIAQIAEDTRNARADRFGVSSARRRQQRDSRGRALAVGRHHRGLARMPGFSSSTAAS